MSKYKIDDKVKIRKDIEINGKYNDYIFLPEMAPLIGQVITITDAAEMESSVYSCKELKDTYFYLTDEMLEDATEKEPEWVYIVHDYENCILCVTKDSKKAEDVAIDYVGKNYLWAHDSNNLDMSAIEEGIRQDHSYATDVWIDYEPID